jgi:hypothetical protein
MIRIEVNPNDIRDIERIFELCKDNPEIFKYDRGDYSKYWFIRMEQLKDALNGRAYHQDIYGSSFTTIDSKPINRNRKHSDDLESELDVFDNE